MLKLICVCGMGLGSSVIAKMNIEEILKSSPLEARVDTCDIGSIQGVVADYYITTKELAENIPEAMQAQTIVLSNFVNKAEIEAVLVDQIKGWDN
ncbi:PTS sugar transporter subunit IIB [Enterococcus faecalis]|uniref:PTS sugar transporter subunit IIB n=1 Tax=Enterococcus faecalis TaxID=1351 RepID=UPI0024544B09|nr:PTS sugar transporter subunit IIB [Enterococcus faecalis]MDH5045328.1 PTS sugar transporter subunit IIB [Enterococcus faecalis]